MSRAWKRRLGGVALSGLLVFLAFAAPAAAAGAAAAGAARSRSGARHEPRRHQAEGPRRGAGQPRHLVRLRGPVVGEAVHAADRLQGEHEGRRELGRHDRPDLDRAVRRRVGVRKRERAAHVARRRRPDQHGLHPELCGRPGGDQEPVVQQPRRQAVRRPHGRGPNLLMFRTDARPEGHEQLGRDLGQVGALQRQALDLRRLDLHRGRGRLPEGDAARPEDRRTRTSSTTSSSARRSTCSRSRLRRSATTGPATSRSRCRRSRTRTLSSARPGRTR